MPPTMPLLRSIARIPSRQTPLPVLDFLAPRTIAIPHRQISPPSSSLSSRHHSTASTTTNSTNNTNPNSTPSPAPKYPSMRSPLTPEQSSFLDSALRVNQAGELAAVLIYASQTPPLIRAHPNLRPLMKHMYDQEAGHFQYFNALIAKHRVRPTAMYPVWHAAASVLGWGTAVMGREAAMACTEAVETEIGSHYNEQVRVLLDWAEKMEGRGEEVSAEFKGMVGELRRIRDEELEHLDHAVENDAKGARPYELLTNVIRGGCRTAIWITERV
ncbi:COQ7-domain-containing protein [Aaosphaeria arxii CBS 175.79]|uniref:5-demethoxyubiquinone hydroxylase, mitochondrial n=1 Tax=Aaosphaeria arxii CBS 175.79 TaxID=1450172 RepID=A0A6A5Y7Y7_9PLEO|nr:COQ7-domain-containing protein [Aaosphaeria arxii CBS 175.79]KAF2020920.1 COQ7-domain-containing protein [Aaosphaeria arxii CBS 175.79]